MNWIVKIFGSLTTLAVLCFFFPIPYAHASGIVFDTSIAFTGGTGTNVITISNYPMAVTNSGIVLLGFVADTSDLLTGATFNGSTMTCLKAQAPAYRWGYLCYLLGATGTHNFVVTFSSTPSFFSASGFSYTGVKTAAIDSSNTGTGTAVDNLTVSTTVVAANSWLTGFFLDNTIGTQAAGTGTHQIRLGNTNFGVYDSNGTVSAGSHSLAVNTTGNTGPWVGIVASIAPSTAATFNPWQFFAF